LETPPSGEEEEVIRAVREKFVIKEFFYRPDGVLEFEIEPTDLKENFKKLWIELKGKGLVPFSFKRGEDTVLFIGRIVLPPTKEKFLVPVLLFFATLGTLLIDGWLQSGFILKYLPGFTQWSLMLMYAASILGIVGMHEVGHLVASRRWKMKASLPYMIPGFPGVIPTFGAVIFAREPLMNRDSQFDVGISGPLVGFMVAIIVAYAGAFTSVFIPYEEIERMIKAGEAAPVGVSLIQRAVFEFAIDVPPGKGILFSPLAYAAWFGFLITFLNVLPAWQLDGGHTFRSVFGERPHRIASFASAALMAMLGFLPMALLILLLSMRRSPPPLDAVSPLSTNRKFAYLFLIAIMILTMPPPRFL